MREVQHGVDQELPPRMPGPMSKDDLWQAAEWATRVLGEATRRAVAPDVFEKLDVARGITLAMYLTTDEPGHSVKVPLTVAQ